MEETVRRQWNGLLQKLIRLGALRGAWIPASSNRHTPVPFKATWALNIALMIACCSTGELWAQTESIPPLPPRLTKVSDSLYRTRMLPERDVHGYPSVTVDKRQLARFLTTRSHAQLEERLRILHQQTRADVRYELNLTTAYYTFHRTDSIFGARLDDWVATRPESPEARFARANYYLARAWKSRGTKAEMMTFTEAAAQDAAAGMERQPDNLEAFDLMLGMLRLAGWSDEQEAVLAQGLSLYPTSAVLRETALQNMVPAWGGSFQRMQQLAEEAATLADRNPRLAVLRGYIDAEQGRLHFNEGDNAAAVHYYTQALSFGDDGSFYLGRAEAYLAAGDYTRALADLNKAWLQYPQGPNTLDLRARSLYALVRYAPSRIALVLLDRAYEDAALLREINPEHDAVNELIDAIGQSRARCRAGAPRC
jgi:tetratricopeptide (TPR) repeat protein